MSEANRTEDRQLPRRNIYVNVKLLSPPPWRYEWRTVYARDFQEAEKLAEQMLDVHHVCEMSFIPGGVVT